MNAPASREQAWESTGPRRENKLGVRREELGVIAAVLGFAINIIKATPHNSRLAAKAPLRQLRHGICVAKMLDNVGLRYPHRASGAKAPRTLRPLPLLRFAVSAAGGAHLCSIQYYLRFWLGICRTSLAVSALRIIRYCLTSFCRCRRGRSRGRSRRSRQRQRPAAGSWWRYRPKWWPAVKLQSKQHP